MNEGANFSIIMLDNVKENFEILKNICDRLNIKVTLEKANDNYGIDLGLLSFSWDDYDLETKLTRKAGRKSKFRVMDYRTDEIRQKIQTQGANATALELGISRQWMYKRLKEAEKEGRIYF